MKLILTVVTGEKFELYSDRGDDRKPDLNWLVNNTLRNNFIWVSPTKVVFANAISSIEALQ
jgi:hypothetical protein